MKMKGLQMKYLPKLALIMVLILVAAIAFNNTAYSGVNNSAKIAIVDVQEIALKYSKVSALQKSQQTKVLELQKMVDSARNEIVKEKDATKRKQLEEKYNQQILAKKKVMDDEYKKQLVAIDNDIILVVGNLAKANKYDYVFAKNAVLYGGKNITADVLNNLK
jgi:Skp family chaperone for outer membrane proteins